MVNWFLGGILLVVGIVALFLKEKLGTRSSDVITIALNLIASGIVLLVSQLLNKFDVVWPYLAVAVGTSILTALVIRKGFSPGPDPAQEQQLLDHTQEQRLRAAEKMGLLGFWSNYIDDYAKDMKQEFGHDIRKKLKSSSGIVRIIGIDWTELFGAGVSGTSEYYEDSLMTTKDLHLKVLLLDPRGPFALEKRKAEFRYKPTGGNPKYQINHPNRVYGKIIGSAEILSDYHRRYPDRVEYRFTQVPPIMCAFITDEEAIFHHYYTNLKGWDSPLLIVNKTDEYGLYDVISDYFEYSWQYLGKAISDEDWDLTRSELAAELRRFDEIIASGCMHEDRRDCIIVHQESHRESDS